jgi:hypothetical protein
MIFGIDMSKNSRKNESINLLRRAVTLLPNEKAKRHVNNALAELYKSDKKKNKKMEQETVEQKWKEDLKNRLVNPLDGRRTLDTIEAMIEAEKAKAELKKEQSKKEKNNTDTDELTLTDLTLFD